MSEKPKKSYSRKEMVHRINGRWIVHGELKENAKNYLLHLEETDSARLERSCGIALKLVHVYGNTEDPKPLFYAGLFSLATAEEMRRYLSTHLLTQAVWHELQGRITEGLTEPMEKLARNLAKRVTSALSDPLLAEWDHE